MTIYEMLPKGEENAIKSRDLANQCGYHSIRDLRAKVAAERHAGAAILSTSKHGGGYFRADDGEKGMRELEACRRTLTAKAANLFGALRPIHKELGIQLGQMDLDNYL